ncbi:hypothetical protein PENSPDRAFT_733059 [Peniophora sp. CONT]|nr:hypothetical protein PENSPDRAFT_733059 [Peniophora sp. CONT]
MAQAESDSDEVQILAVSGPSRSVTAEPRTGPSLVRQNRQAGPSNPSRLNSDDEIYGRAPEPPLQPHVAGMPRTQSLGGGPSTFQPYARPAHLAHSTASVRMRGHEPSAASSGSQTLLAQPDADVSTSRSRPPLKASRKTPRAEDDRPWDRSPGSPRKRVRTQSPDIPGFLGPDAPPHVISSDDDEDAKRASAKYATGEQWASFGLPRASDTRIPRAYPGCTVRTTVSVAVAKNFLCAPPSVKEAMIRAHQDELRAQRLALENKTPGMQVASAMPDNDLDMHDEMDADQPEPATLPGSRRAAGHQQEKIRLRARMASLAPGRVLRTVVKPRASAQPVAQSHWRNGFEVMQECDVVLRKPGSSVDVEVEVAEACSFHLLLGAEEQYTDEALVREVGYHYRRRFRAVEGVEGAQHRPRGEDDLADDEEEVEAPAPRRPRPRPVKKHPAARPPPATGSDDDTMQVDDPAPMFDNVDLHTSRSPSGFSSLFGPSDDEDKPLPVQERFKSASRRTISSTFSALSLDNAPTYPRAKRMSAVRPPPTPSLKRRRSPLRTYTVEELRKMHPTLIPTWPPLPDEAPEWFKNAPGLEEAFAPSMVRIGERTDRWDIWDTRLAERTEKRREKEKRRREKEKSG